jgi:hypothetical protein
LGIKKPKDYERPKRNWTEIKMLKAKEMLRKRRKDLTKRKETMTHCYWLKDLRMRWEIKMLKKMRRGKDLRRGKERLNYLRMGIVMHWGLKKH